MYFLLRPYKIFMTINKTTEAEKELKEENAAIRNQNRVLQDAIVALQKRNNELEEENKILYSEIAHLKAIED